MDLQTITFELLIQSELIQLYMQFSLLRN